MPHLDDIPARNRDHIITLDCPTFDAAPFVAGPPLNRRRVAMVS